MYVGTISGAGPKAAIAAGHLAGMVAPGGGSNVPAGAWWAADNGRYGEGWPGLDEWWAWLTVRVERFGPARCLFAVAPDVVGDATATLADARPWLPRIRALGVPAAYVAQDGSDVDQLMPWGEFDVLFIGGTDAFKLGPATIRLVAAAKARGLWTHMGRVNSRTRLRYAHHLGCDSADGTYIARGPDINLPRVLAWLRELDRQIAFDDPERTSA